MATPELPQPLFDEYFDKYFANGGCADHLIPREAREEWSRERRTDVADSFQKLRGHIGNLLAEAGVESPEAADVMCMYTAIQERRGFESGVKFVHDTAHVTSKQAAAMQISTLHNMKTVGY